MYTKNDKLIDRCTHAEYYRQIIKETGYQVKLSPRLIKSVKIALGEGNLWLIDVPRESLPMDLALWGDLAVKVNAKKLDAVLKARGDQTAQLTTLYLNKEYARMKCGSGQVMSHYRKILAEYKKGSSKDKTALRKELRNSWRLTLREERVN